MAQKETIGWNDDAYDELLALADENRSLAHRAGHLYAALSALTVEQAEATSIEQLELRGLVAYWAVVEARPHILHIRLAEDAVAILEGRVEASRRLKRG